MRPVGKLVRANRRSLITGLCNGILTALTFGAGELAGAPSGLTSRFAVRLALAAAVSSAFVLFVAHYSQLRGELAEAERQLNLTAHGRLAASRLGRAVLRESGLAALIGAAGGFSGASLPLLLSLFVPDSAWLSIAAAVAGLAMLGGALAVAVGGHAIVWAAGLACTGAAAAALGTYLRLV